MFSQQKDKIGIRCIYSCTRVIISVTDKKFKTFDLYAIEKIFVIQSIVKA